MWKSRFILLAGLAVLASLAAGCSPETTETQEKSRPEKIAVEGKGPIETAFKPQPKLDMTGELLDFIFAEWLQEGNQIKVQGLVRNISDRPLHGVQAIMRYTVETEDGSPEAYEHIGAVEFSPIRMQGISGFVLIDFVEGTVDNLEMDFRLAGSKEPLLFRDSAYAEKVEAFSVDPDKEDTEDENVEDENVEDEEFDLFADEPEEPEDDPLGFDEPEEPEDDDPFGFDEPEDDESDVEEEEF